jgi:hypothetical protein
MGIIRYVNKPSSSPNYNYYADAINAAIDGDTIQVYNNDQLVLSFTYKNPVTKTNERKDLTDDLGKFLFTFVNSSNPDINQVKSGKKLYLDYNSNKFKLANITNANTSVNGENEFVGSKFNLISSLASNQNLLVGIGDNLLLDNKDLDNGFFIKLINSSNFNPNDVPDLNNPIEQNLVVEKFTETTNTNVIISVPTEKNDLTKQEFIDKMHLYKSNDKFEKINLLKSNQTSYSVTKNNEKTFTVEIPSDGIIMFLDPNRYQEYAINQISHAVERTQINNKIVNRSGNELYNLGQAPKKGRFNGWRLNKTTQNFISYTLYNKTVDYDISGQQIEYFWVCIYQPVGQSQTINLNISGTNYILITGNTIGRYVFWYSSFQTTFVNKEKFNLLNLTSTFIKINGPTVNNVSYVNINTSGLEIKCYIESYGFSTSTQTFNFALTSSRDNTIKTEEQLCLDNQVIYDLLINKIVQVNSCFPMDSIKSGPNTTSNGWYFDSSKDFNLKLLDDDDIDIPYSNLYTLFVEVLISSNANINIGCFGESIKINESGKKIIYFKNSPFILESENAINAPINQMVARITSNDGKYYQNIAAGNYSYVVSFYTQEGETTCSQNLTTVTLSDGTGQVLLENIPVSSNSNVIGRKIYRTKLNDTTGLFYLLHTINDNITTKFYDVTPQKLLGVPMPQINTANKKFNFPYFPYLDSNLNGVLVNGSNLFANLISPEKKVGELLLNIGNQTDIELISYGYKLLGEAPIHLMSRWSSLESNAIVHHIDKFLTIQKDVINLSDDTEIDVDSKFKVKAYGNFFSGNYKQYGDAYGDIRVNINVNIEAIKNALYILESADISNYTINVSGLKYQALGVSTVKSDGLISESVVLFNNKSKYIIPDYAIGSTFSQSNYITYVNSQEVFYKNGGIIPVLTEGVYAALFKEFNKSASILNTTILDSFGQTVYQVDKPNVALITYTTENSTNLIPGAIYSYRVTYYTSIGETEGSIPSNDIVEPFRQAKKIKVEITKSLDQRVIGRRIYRRTLDKQNNKYIYIDTISNNTDNFYIDDKPDPISINVQPPTLVFLTNNETNYNSINVPRLLTNTTSELTASSTYLYAFSYYNNNGAVVLETELSDSSLDVFIGADPYKIILNLPVSPSSVVTGRFIYRTKANSSVFYLLADVPNNTSTIYIDNISDINLGEKTPVETSTLPNITKPLLTSIGGNFFARAYIAQFSTNFITSGIYKYKFTYVIASSTGEELGETAPSDASDSVTQPISKAVRIYVNVPTSSDPNVIKRNIYRTEASGTVFKYVTTINNNTTSVFVDNISDANLGRAAVNTNTTEIIVPETNTTTSSGGNIDPINNLISDMITEDNVPVSNSKLFKMYVKSGRYAKDTGIYNVATNTIQMNLDNMEINIKCRLRGIMYDVSQDSTTIKFPLTKQLAELIFGKFDNPASGIGGEPETLVREVIRVGNTTMGVDEVGNILEMLNNETNIDGSYKINSEIQYIIDFSLALVQRNN